MKAALRGNTSGGVFCPGNCIIQENRQKGKEREKIMTESLQKAVLIYLFLINLTAFSIYGIDKYKAKHRQWRIPEATLLLSAALGGSVGALLGMRLFHHKTKKPRFFIGVPAILLLQAAAAYFLLMR